MKTRLLLMLSDIYSESHLTSANGAEMRHVLEKLVNGRAGPWIQRVAINFQVELEPACFLLELYQWVWGEVALLSVNLVSPEKWNENMKSPELQKELQTYFFPSSISSHLINIMWKYCLQQTGLQLFWRVDSVALHSSETPPTTLPMFILESGISQSGADNPNTTISQMHNFTL